MSEAIRRRSYPKLWSTEQIHENCIRGAVDFRLREAIARLLVGAPMAVSILSAVTIVSAEVPAAPDARSVRQAYEACLSSEATKGTYTASDGGISALRLMDQCKPQLDAWRPECIATGQTVNQCNLLAASYAQAVLEQRKRSSQP